MGLSNLEIRKLQNEYEQRDPQDVLRLALDRYTNVSISFSGAEDVILIDMAIRLRKDISVFSLDTGRLHPETYKYLDRVKEHFGIDLEILFPDSREVESLVKNKGLFSFYQDGHGECCAVRKVAPLRRKLQSLDAWITGQRRDQSPGTRTNVPVIEEDKAFGTSEHPLVKFNPLAHWTSAEVWSYIRENNLPFNELHRKGYTSIGCEPCTRPVLPNDHERLGRWWWETATAKECGLHIANTSTG